MQPIGRFLTLISITSLLVLASFSLPLLGNSSVTWAGSRPEPIYIHKKAKIGFALVDVEGQADPTRPQHYYLSGRSDLRKKGWGPDVSISVSPYRDPVVRGDVYMCGRRIFHGLVDFKAHGFKFPWRHSMGRMEMEGEITYIPVYAPTNSGSGGPSSIVEWEAYFNGDVVVNLWYPYGKRKTKLGNQKIDQNGSFKKRFWKMRVLVNVVTFDMKWEWDK